MVDKRAKVFDNNIGSTTRSHVHVVSELRRDILLGRYATGSRIVESDLAESYRVSRGAVREALQTLIMEGLIEERNKARIVLGIDARAIENMYELREWIETKAVKSLLQPQLVKYSAFVSVLESLEQLSPKTELDEYYAKDLEFHRVLVKLAGNRAILLAWETMSSVIYTLLSVNASSRYEEHYKSSFVEKHRDILTKIITRDESVVETVRKHIQDACEITLETVAMIDNGNSPGKPDKAGAVTQRSEV